jgi:branched-subunit amino acid transport protein
MTGLGTMLLIAAASWALRAGFVVLVPASRTPAQVRTALEHLPPSVLAALVAVDLVGSAGPSHGLRESGVVVGVAAVLAAVAWRTRNVAAVSLLALAAVVAIDLGPW